MDKLGLAVTPHPPPPTAGGGIYLAAFCQPTLCWSCRGNPSCTDKDVWTCCWHSLCWHWCQLDQGWLQSGA